MRLWRSQPAAFSVLLLAAICAVAGAVSWSYSSALCTDVQDALRSLNQHPPVVVTPVVQTPPAGADLPPFDGAAFTTEFLATARDAGVPTDEVGYALESGAAQPYMRYRITLEAKSGYFELRKFIAALAMAQPNVALDAIRCRRDDAGAVTLACQLTFSAFFRKAGHG